MQYYSIVNALIDIAFLPEWIIKGVWGIYDPATDTSLSPCAWKNECIGMHSESDPIMRIHCLLMFDYCIFTQASTIVLCSLFSVLGIAIACFFGGYSLEKIILHEQRKLDHTE